MSEDDDYERHLREREAQNYRSTRRWNPHPDVLGMIGERALAKYFGVPQDFRNRPGGDGGIDLQLKLRDYGEEWWTLDAKCSTWGDYLRCPKGEVKDKTIYVYVHAISEKTRKGICKGWLWGLSLRFTPALAWFRGDIICHRWPVDELKKMQELTDRKLDWRHQPRGEAK